MKPEFLDPSLSRRFRKEMNKHYNILHNVYKRWDQWNLFCAVADRIDDCIEYLNKHAAEPPKRTEFVIFLVYSCMICDAIRQIFFAFRDFKKQNKNVPLSPYKFDFPENNQYFKEDIQKQVNDNAKKLTDDQFLKYIRALVFAHPFETSQSKILQKKERQYSPFIVDNDLLENKNNIGISIYSNLQSGSKILQFPFPVLKEYIKSRYLLLNDVMENLKKLTEVKEYEWKQHKVNRELKPIDILNDIIQILGERDKDVQKDKIVRAKEFLSCKITKNENIVLVQEYRKKNTFNHSQSM